MSEQSEEAQPYRVVYSEMCRDQAKILLTQAQESGQFEEVARAIQEINDRLEWIPLDFGEPLQDFVGLGIKEHIGVHGPLVVKYGVDEQRRIVYVTLPIRLLSRYR